jgi:hypothetical protein
MARKKHSPERSSRQRSPVIYILGSALPIFPKEQLRQATQGYRTEENCQTDCAPAIYTERNDADTVEETKNRHHQKERPCDVAVHPSAPDRIDYARGPHYAEGGRPNCSSQAQTDIMLSGCDNRDDWKAKPDRSEQRIRKDVARLAGCCVTLH